jgi:outer membrane protein insertion porin family
MFQTRNYIIIFTAIAFFASCSPLKKVPKDDALYTGATVKIDGPALSKKKKKNLRQDLETLSRPKRNKRFLGIPFKLLLNNIPIVRKKLGEPPVLLSSLNLEHNIKVLRSSLENRGYFHATVEGDTVVKKRKAKAIYTVQTGAQYMINNVAFTKDTADLEKAIAESADKTFLKTGEPFDLDLIKGERERIDAYLKERGFYFFNPDFIIVQVDSTIGNNKVNLFVKVKPAIPLQARNIYTINEVYIFTNYQLQAQTQTTDTLKSSAVFYKGYYVVDKRKRYNPRMFSQAMQFDPGDIYTRTDHSKSISRLVNLNIFKFVKNRFETVPGVDSPKLNAFYYLTPFPKKSIRAEINGSTKSNNLTGSSISIGWRNRNTFRGGEIFSIDATGGFEVQFSGQLTGFNTYRGGLEAKLAVPRFMTPFFTVNPRGGFMPKTNILLGYDILTKQKLYTMQSFRAGFGYVWKESLEKEHQFNPIAINYVQPLVITQLYQDSAANNPTLLKAVEKQFILGSNYNYNYNGLQGKPPMSGGTYFNANVDLSGNIAGLVSGANVNAGKPTTIFNAQFSQYVKLEADYRRYFKLSPTSVLANRAIIGFGLPYGNSTALPYIKQFFVGGTNSVRAFRSRSIGPGTYKDTAITTFLPDQSGDIKLELNTEYRVKIAGPVHGAVFIDAGNIWLFNNDHDIDSLKHGAKFTKNFLKELAVGTGVGIRLDISFLVIRLDVAFPLRKPWLPDGSRWVINQISFGNSTWRRENIIFNLGIGYPF